MSVIFVYPICGLLSVFCEKFYNSACGIAFILVFILCLAVLIQHRAINSGPNFFVDRDGTITTRRISYSTSRFVTFEKGHYEFLVEERHEEETYIADGPNFGPYDEYTMIVKNEDGMRFKLFSVQTYDEIEEFKKRFSEFTGIA
jgi:hypothetical protein